MADFPLVSVVVAAYGHARYLPSTLDAIMHQDYPNLELVIVEDASPDNTRDVLRRWRKGVKEENVDFASRYDEATGEVYRQSHPRYPEREICVIHNERNLGATETYNVGYQAARGDLVTNISDDDLPHPTMISTLVEAVQRGFDYAYGDMWIVDDEMRVLRAFRLPDYDPARVLADWYLMGVCKLYCKELHERAGWYDPAYRIAQDHDMALRFAMAGARIAHVPKVLYSHRFHGDARKVGLHSPDNEKRMFDESKEVARRARAWLAGSR